MKCPFGIESLPKSGSNTYELRMNSILMAIPIAMMLPKSISLRIKNIYYEPEQMQPEFVYAFTGSVFSAVRKQSVANDTDLMYDAAFQVSVGFPGVAERLPGGFIY